MLRAGGWGLHLGETRRCVPCPAGMAWHPSWSEAECVAGMPGVSGAALGFGEGEEVTAGILEGLIPWCRVASRATWPQPLSPQTCLVFSFRPSSSQMGRMKS